MVERTLMTITELAEAVDGNILTGGPASQDRNVSSFSSVVIDSRMVKSGSLFVALVGERQDGHDFVSVAFKAGARIALVSSSCMEKDGASLLAAAEKASGSLVVVENTLRALQAAAHAYVLRFPRLIRVGITGSSGKTTTKELTAAMIGIERRVVMNEGNLNSETGLPLSVFSIREADEIGVFELGMNRQGEISELASVLFPHIALITNVGTAHIGILGNRDGIAKEKKEIFSRFDGNQLALVPEADPYTSYLASGVRGTVKYWGPKSLATFGGARSLGLDGTEFVWDGKPVRLALPGAHNLQDALAAAAIAEAVGVSSQAIRAGIAAAKPLFGRGEILRGRPTVIRDCYNANPESMEAAISFCDSVEWLGRRVYVIGAMRELGANAESSHARLGELLAASKGDEIFLYGEETSASVFALKGRKTFFQTSDFELLSDRLAAALRPEDLLLLKGSRALALERLMERLPIFPAGDVPARRGD